MSTPQGTKHSRTPSSAEHESTAKRVQTHTSSHESLEQAIEQIDALKTQLNNVLDWVEKAGMSTGTPPMVWPRIVCGLTLLHQVPRQPYGPFFFLGTVG